MSTNTAEDFPRYDDYGNPVVKNEAFFDTSPPKRGALYQIFAAIFGPIYFAGWLLLLFGPIILGLLWAFSE